MTPLRIALLIFALGLARPAHAGENFGITRQTHGSSVFTFRDGKLLHEATTFKPVTPSQHDWIEVFYDGAVPVFVRSGFVKDGKRFVTSERFTGLSALTVIQMSNGGADHPSRISVGKETFNRANTGFFEIVPDPQTLLRESVVMGAETSTKELDRVREMLLKPSPAQ